MDKITMEKAELAKMLDEVSTAAASKAVEAKLKELGLGEKKFSLKGAYSEKSEAEIAAMGKKEKMAGFIKAVFNNDKESIVRLSSKALMNEGTGSAGGFVVPEEFAAEVNRVVEDFGLVPKLARKFPMSHDILNVPRLASSVTSYYVSEGAAGTASQPVLERVVLTAKTLIGLTPMSNELLADANISVVDLLVELFAESIAGSMDSQGLAGTGSPFTGILADAGVTAVYAGNSSTSGKDTFTEAATADYCRDLISNVKPWALQGAAFIMHRTIWSLIQQSKMAGTGDYAISAYNPVVTGANTTQAFPNASAGTLWGYPVYLSDKMPALSASAASTKLIIFGNLKHLYVGMRADMSVAISDSATIGSDNLFAQNMSAVRVVTRHAIAVGLPTAFACLETSAS